MERANYNWANYEDYVKSHDQDDQEMEYRPRYDANPDDDYDDDNEEEEDYSEGFQEQVEEQVEQQADYAADDYDDDNEEEDYAKGFQEQVEHETDYAADDSDESDFNGQFGWRSKARRGKRGRFVPPDTRAFVAPVFVRVADLKAGAASGSGEEREPGGMSDDGMAGVAPKSWC